MTSELRRSFKQKAKETFGFRLNRRSDGDIRPGSLDELDTPPQSAPPTLSSPTPHPSNITIATKESATMATRPTSMVQEFESSMETREKRRSRHMTQPKGTISYEVAGRDTLASIAAQFDTTTSELKKVNKLMTTMVFPGQVVFVPDKDYVPSEKSTPTPPSPASPASPPSHGDRSTDPSSTTRPSDPPGTTRPSDLSGQTVENGTASPPMSDAKTAFDIKLTRRPKAPGLAKRQVSSDEPVSPAHVPPSEDEARKLADECCERFIKVNVKHITDGQGVVSGVLLVTPNAIMFDPNVSDPLVMDRGPEEYGMIAPIDTIISAAIYHDIAAMNQRNRVRTDSGGPAMEVYHDKTCALYKNRSIPSPEPEPQDMSPLGRLPRSESVCSCGAMDRNKSLLSSSRDRNTYESSAQVVRVNSTAKIGFLGESFSLPKDIPESSNDDEDFGYKPPDGPAVSGDAPSETSQQSSISAATKDEAASQPADIELDSRKPVTDGEGGQVQVKETCDTDPDSHDASTNTSRTAVCGTLSPPIQTGHTQYFSHDSRRSPSPQKDDLSIPRDSGGSPRPSSSPKDQGLLSRTLGSLSSLGSSFPGSPNLTSLATGLFNWNQDSGLEPPVSAASLLRDRSVEDGEVFVETEDAERKSAGESSEGKSLGESMDSAEREGRRIQKILDVEVEVENLVKLQDKPELFQDLNTIELIPKPATHYEDLPLYLCLRIGLPSNKKVSKTCPIESYMKHKNKPEYWFCVPRDKVDPLYAFFLQWSPNIYGSEDEMAEREQGFVVVTHSDDDGDMDLIDNHFDRMSLKSRQMTKDWEIVNLEEARRRLSCAEVENLPLPELSDPSFILDESHMRRLCLHLPARAEGYPWTLIYSSEKHGFSLKTLYRTMYRMDCPILLIIKDTESHVFGAILPCAIVLSDHFYGTGESFLFTFYPEFKRFGWSGANNFFIKGNPESLSIGAGKGSFGLWLDGDLYHGTTQSCETYNNDLLTESEDFVVKGLEAWGFL